jgi:hypothetical protein
MEDHYVRAHGPDGSALILMRMRDAVAELDDYLASRCTEAGGLRARAVERVEKEDGRARLRLTNGMIVPVARSQTGAVKAQGWPQP